MTFARGNLVGTALTGSALGAMTLPTPGDALQSAAALGLIGGGAKALDALGSIDSLEARLYHALALWIDGQDDEAARQLALAPSGPPTEALRALLHKERIRALCFLPAHRSGPHGIFTAQNSDPRLEISNIWFHALPGEGIPNKVDAEIQHFYHEDCAPDLLIAEMVEWHVLPRNIADAPFFKVGHTSDFDIHGQEVVPWLSQFNAILTLDHTEWGSLSRALPYHPVLTYPKVFTTPVRDLNLLSLERPIDVLMTGTVLSDFHQDKNELVTRLANLPGLRSLLLNGFVSHESYEAITALSKLTLSFVRHSGTMPTRALESLALGTWCLLQNDSALHLYLPDDAAVLPYRFGEWASFSRDITEFVAQFPKRQHEYATKARETASAIFAQFNPARVASQYFRFCAALPVIMQLLKLEASAVTPRPEIQKRGCVVKGWLPASGNEGVLRGLLECNVRRLKKFDSSETQNQIGREFIIEYARLLNNGDVQPTLLRAGLEAFSAALGKDPSALAPRFNMIRALYHFGNTEQRQEAERYTRELLVLAQDPAELHLNAWDDLLPYDFYPSHFNGQLCAEHRLAAFGGSAGALQSVRQLIIASAQYYLARGLGTNLEAQQHYQRALDLDPNNPHFQLGYSLFRLSNNADPCGLAKEYIGYAIEKKHWTPLVGNLHRQLIAPSADSHAQGSVLFFDIDDEAARQFRYHQAKNLDMSGDLYRCLRNSKSSVASLALILCGSGIISNPTLNDILQDLRRRTPQVEIVVIDTLLDVTGSPLSACVDILVSAPQAGNLAYSSMVVSDVLAEVRAPYVFIAQPELCDLTIVIEHVIRFASPADIDADLTKVACAPLLLIREGTATGTSRELVCVSAATEFFRRHSLLQRNGVLQASNLMLPLLMFNLRTKSDRVFLANHETGEVCSLDSKNALLDISHYVSHEEDRILSILSWYWRQVRDGVQPDRQGSVLTAFNPDSFLYRAAREFYRRYLRERRTPQDRSDQGVIAVNFVFLRFEYEYPNLIVKLRLPSFLDRRQER
jgi:tetratricopeptide (TPR) repeat protein